MTVIMFEPKYVLLNKRLNIHTQDGLFELLTHDDTTLAVQFMRFNPTLYISVWDKIQVHYIQKFKSMSAGLPIS